MVSQSRTSTFDRMSTLNRSSYGVICHGVKTQRLIEGFYYDVSVTYIISGITVELAIKTRILNAAYLDFVKCSRSHSSKKTCVLIR